MGKERLADLLGSTTGRGASSARRTASPEDLNIDIAGIGPLDIPVSATQARQLRAIARPARYGLGEQTLTDTRVRHTWEVAKSRVRIDKRRWNRTLTPILDGLRADLGLPDGCRFKAELHSFLVYAPGQFFVPHQDSEKSDAMVGTLTVTLPGTSKGGALVVEHGEERATYRSSDRLLSFVAFYSDCRHEVRPVRSGYRVVLTYNLLLAGDTTAGPTPAPDTVAELSACLNEHFAEQNRLVYLLDHQYTARGLSWSRLKGVDAARVSALVAAAQASDCETVLALADVRESREANERYDGDRYWHDPENGDEDEAYEDVAYADDNAQHDDVYEVGDLLDSSTSLNTWIDRSGAPARPISTTVRPAEVCETTPTDELTPYESQYEGYMGNYGNTMDRWYRRGAVAIWPRSLDFSVRAQASPDWALESLDALLRDGEQARARELTRSMASFRVGVRDADDDEPVTQKPSLGLALAVAHGLDDPSLATKLLAPFRLELLTPADAPLMVALTDRHGESWTRTLLEKWAESPNWYRTHQERPGWVAALPELCNALHRSGGRDVATILLAACWDWLAEELGRARSLVGPTGRAQRLDGLTLPIAGVLVGAAVSGATDVGDTALAFLTDGDDALLHCLVNVLRALSDAAPEYRIASGSEALARHVRQRLEFRLARPIRDADDWSIEMTGGCPCGLCAKLRVFLADPASRSLEWPLKQESRRHIHGRIDMDELPVQHRTRKAGRPYTLVLTKTPALFEREAQTRQRDEADLQWLRGRAEPPGQA